MPRIMYLVSRLIDGERIKAGLCGSIKTRGKIGINKPKLSISKKTVSAVAVKALWRIVDATLINTKQSISATS